ncbi:AFG1-like ATPase-domain-containing protein [Lineolata rhizophorae]|uniref:AFG1-like ATPase-domain-containing protein n=1 Tax=Lineolata rhizophorae TaxID=578093 RepID=A0A6A6PCY6_9PEZI|nr:AFG1-like ATPase-domain-containing protein [Lineolata rhizophorae]
MPPNGSRSGLTITNPLVLYRTLVATKRIAPDHGQHRLAIHLQKLYDRLKDYEPSPSYSERLNQLSHSLSNARHDAANTASSSNAASLGTRGVWRSLLEHKEKRDILALTRVLTSHEAALALDSPRGLLLHGEVGTGKSMLVDLFAGCLPARGKRRVHFNAFMLETYARLERLRRRRSRSGGGIGPGMLPDEMVREEHVLLALARDLVAEAPILFLDEFQLPDRTAAKIVSGLLTAFFHLGGVLIATSNRMPDELAKAAGVEFRPPPSTLSSAVMTRVFGSAGWRRKVVGGEPFAGRGEYAAFLEVLKARCEVWEMDGRRDFRRVEYESSGSGSGQTAREVVGETEQPLGEDAAGTLPKFYSIGIPQLATVAETPASLPPDTLATILPTTPVQWQPITLTVYARQLYLPHVYEGHLLATFASLCAATLGPADYASISRSFHTIILTDVPVLTLSRRNEARRFITMLDALYEARCRLFIVRAEAEPDGIFFPDASTPRQDATGQAPEAGSATAIHAETMSEAYQDIVEPFRPNISSYTASGSSPGDYAHAFPPFLSPDALEDDPPTRMRRAAGEGDQQQRGMAGSLEFGHTAAFTGEDERFAYRRAESRLWEMCGEKWWRRVGPESEGEEKESLGANVGQRWVGWRGGGGAAEEENGDEKADHRAGEADGVHQGAETEDDSEGVFRHGASPFRTAVEPPPKIGWTHVWGTAKWGKRAGAWGKGPEGLVERKREMEREQEKDVLEAKKTKS